MTRPRLCLLPPRRYLIIENFIPPEEKNKIMNRLTFDPEEDQWRFQPLVPAQRWGPAADQPPGPVVPAPPGPTDALLPFSQ